MNESRLYYYTDYNTFKLILQNGTLRFKESTSSNDKLDTVQLYNTLISMAKEKIKDEQISDDQRFVFDMINHIGSEPKRVSLVSCFSSKGDSRLLWDAYTMHRKDRQATRYNGVCIEFSKNKIIEAMEKESSLFDIRCCKEIEYGIENINIELESLFQQFSEEVKELLEDPDQSQNLIRPIPVPFSKKEIVLEKSIVYPLFHLFENFDVTAPFIKHSFWSEECETRAMLSMKRGSNKIKELSIHSLDNSRYYDLAISSDCINKVILGPEFSEDDINGLMLDESKIQFSSLKTEKSLGTGIITNK